VSTASLSSRFCVLVVEDDRETADMYAEAIQHELLNSLVLTARSLAEARLLLEKYSFHFFILDIQLPDGLGIDFLHDLGIKQPDACVAIVTGTPLPSTRAQADAFGVLNFMEKPVHLPALIRLLLAHRQNVFAGHAPPSDTGYFSASLSRLSTLDIIQLKCLGHATLSWISSRGLPFRPDLLQGRRDHPRRDAHRGRRGRVQRDRELAGRTGDRSARPARTAADDSRRLAEPAPPGRPVDR